MVGDLSIGNLFNLAMIFFELRLKNNLETQIGDLNIRENLF